MSFIDDFQKIKFYIKGAFSFDIDLFKKHANLNLEHKEDGILVERKEGDSSFNYFTCIYDEPLTEPCVFKVDVLAVYESDRFVDVGIMPKSKVDSTTGTFINSFNSGGISYCGYSHGGGLTGSYPTTTSSDAKGMKPGSHFYFRYEPKKEIKFYDDENTINLKLDMKNKTGDYYLFGVCYHP